MAHKTPTVPTILHHEPTVPTALYHHHEPNEEQSERVDRKTIEGSTHYQESSEQREVIKKHPEIQKILQQVCHEQWPLIPEEVTELLLKIESKYLDAHPCLCASRFRHCLHQLDEKDRKKLAKLCGALHTLAKKHFLIKNDDPIKDTKNGDPRAVQVTDDEDSVHTLFPEREDKFIRTLAKDFVAIVFDVENQNLVRKYDSPDDHHLIHRLEAILDRLIKDYRAVFAIEQVCSKSEEDHHRSEHRKRHEGEDECPEEMKLMKVAWTELSLECTEPNFVTQCENTEPPARETEQLDRSCTNFINQYYELFRKDITGKDQGKSDSSPDQLTSSGMMHRKRKERHDSLGEDRKFIRSSSEILEDKEATSYSTQIRRCSSSSHVSGSYQVTQHNAQEVLQKDRSNVNDNEKNCLFYLSDEDHKPPHTTTHEPYMSPKESHGPHTVSLESHSGRPHSHRHHRKQRKDLSDLLKENNNKSSDSEISRLLSSSSAPVTIDQTDQVTWSPIGSSTEEDSKPPSPSSSPLTWSWLPPGLRRDSSASSDTDSDLDWNSIEPARSHPKSMNMISTNRHLDPTQIPSSPRRTPDPDHPKRAKLKQLNRQLSNVKRKLEELQREFEAAQGYKMSHAEKHNHKVMKKLLSEQSAIKRNIRCIRDETDSSSPSTSNNNDNSSRDLEAMRAELELIEARLKTQRDTKKRPSNVEDMNVEQIIQEKVDLQAALLSFEGRFGHPQTPEEKAVMKDIYDRYRNVKRFVRRSSSIRQKETLELETIPENEEVPLTLASPQHRINIEVNSKLIVISSPSANRKKILENFHKSKDMDMPSFVHDPEDRGEENLHALSRYELLQVQHKTREEKKLFRRAIKDIEEKFLLETGRRLLKEDRDEKVYQLYKNTKSKLKLIEALLSKRTVDHVY